MKRTWNDPPRESAPGAEGPSLKSRMSFGTWLVAAAAFAWGAGSFAAWRHEWIGPRMGVMGAGLAIVAVCVVVYKQFLDRAED